MTNGAARRLLLPLSTVIARSQRCAACLRLCAVETTYYIVRSPIHHSASAYHFPVHTSRQSLRSSPWHVSAQSRLVGQHGARQTHYVQYSERCTVWRRWECSDRFFKTGVFVEYSLQFRLHFLCYFEISIDIIVTAEIEIYWGLGYIGDQSRHY